MRVQAEEDELPLSQVFRIATPNDHYNTCRQPDNDNWQSQVDMMLGLLKKKVVEVKGRFRSMVDMIA